ncbi:MAG: polyprenyl synthetase family protein [Firmicutes bacterium]|nr:polyprenyl synthetase family protein [Bacillota bacterium]
MIDFVRKFSAEAGTIREIRSRLSEPMGLVEQELSRLFHEDELLLGKVFRPLKRHVGKRLRPLLVLLSAECFTSDLSRAVKVAACAEMVHTATLIHDDVVDRSNLRRGMATLNSTWGNKVAVLAGDSVFTKALDLLVDQQSFRLLKSMTYMFTEMANGEILQILNYYNADVTMEDYIQRIKRKTALFLAYCCEAGAVLAGASEEEIEALKEYGLKMGLAFQVADDLLDFIGDESKVGKPVCSDLREGNVTLPVIHALQTSAGEEIRQIIEADEITGDDIKTILALLEREKSLEYAYEVAENYVKEAIAALDILEPSQAKKDLVKVAWYALHRQY